MVFRIRYGKEASFCDTWVMEEWFYIPIMVYNATS